MRHCRQSSVECRRGLLNFEQEISSPQQGVGMQVGNAQGTMQITGSLRNKVGANVLLRRLSTTRGTTKKNMMPELRTSNTKPVARRFIALLRQSSQRFPKQHFKGSRRFGGLQCALQGLLCCRSLIAEVDKGRNHVLLDCTQRGVQRPRSRYPW